MRQKEKTHLAGCARRKPLSNGISVSNYNTLRRKIATTVFIGLIVALFCVTSESDYQSAVKYEKMKSIYYQPRSAAVEVAR